MNQKIKNKMILALLFNVDLIDMKDINIVIYNYKPRGFGHFGSWFDDQGKDYENEICIEVEQVIKFPGFFSR